MGRAQEGGGDLGILGSWINLLRSIILAGKHNEPRIFRLIRIHTGNQQVIRKTKRKHIIPYTVEPRTFSHQYSEPIYRIDRKRSTGKLQVTTNTRKHKNGTYLLLCCAVLLCASVVGIPHTVLIHSCAVLVCSAVVGIPQGIALSGEEEPKLLLLLYDITLLLTAVAVTFCNAAANP